MSEAQAQLPKLTRSKRLLAITRKGRLVSYLIPAETLASLLGTQEILSDPKAMKAIRDYESGRTKWKDLDDNGPCSLEVGGYAAEVHGCKARFLERGHSR